jgi:SAM-dependent methyltransferase
MSDVGWEHWFQRNIAKAGGFFKFMYDSWVYSAPLYNTLYALLPPPRRILEVGCGYGTSWLPLTEGGGGYPSKKS